MSYIGLSGTSNSKDIVLDFVSKNKSFVKRYLIKYGSEDRGLFGSTSKGTSFKVGSRTIDVSRSSVNKASNNKLAGMLVASIFHDAVHAARMWTAAGLGSYGSGLGEADILKSIIDLVMSLGPQALELVNSLFQASMGAGAEAAPPPAFNPMMAPEEKKIHPAIIAAGVVGALGLVAFVALRKK